MWLLQLLPACSTLPCSEVNDLEPAPILAIGDSALAFNRASCQSVIDRASVHLGIRIENRAVGGAEVLGGDHPIPDQVPDGAWEQVVVIGGGNDLNLAGVCDGGDADPVLDALADEEGKQGAIPELIDGMVAKGATVLLLGYYEMPPTADFGFGLCSDEFDRLEERYATIAAQRPEVTFLDLSDTLGTDDVAMLADDQVHPNPTGADALGQAIAAALQR